MQWLTSNFGGGITPIKPRLPNHKVAYTWRVGGDLAFAITMLIKPYLVVKKKEAELFLELFKTRYSMYKDQYVWKRREELIEELKNVRKFRDT